MGFPLSTDIFGQLRWLVRQVKLLVFRVTKIEQNGTGGAQNINQVLNVGSTATNKTQTFVVPTGIINIGKDAITGFFPTAIDGIEFQSNLNNTTTSLYELLAIKNTDVSNNIFYGAYGHSEIGFFDSRVGGYFPISIGRSNGYAGGIGFSITNGTGDTVSSDPTQYVITSATTRNNITANSITVSDVNNSGNSLGFNFNIAGVNGSGPILKSTMNTVDVGLYFSTIRTYTIGEEGFGGDNYLGVDGANSRLVAGNSLLRTNVDFNNSAGFIEIIINSQPYYIELWNT
jgi:hypothetical protein